MVSGPFSSNKEKNIENSAPASDGDHSGSLSDKEVSTKKISKRKFLKFLGSLSSAAGAIRTVHPSAKAGGVFTLFQTLFHTPNSEAQTWQKIGNTDPSANTWQKLKLASETKYPYTKIITGSTHSLALRADGVVFATGNNIYGQLGDSTNISKKTFTSAQGLSNVVDIAAGNHSIAFRADGLVFATGYNQFGQLGDSTSINKNTFVSAQGVSNVVAIAASGSHSIALRADGLVFATGLNTAGQLGDNSVINKLTFVSSI